MALPELLAPAGDFATARAAFAAGADAVYLGLKAFSARAEAVNFSPEDLHALAACARSFTPAKKFYVALNTLLTDAEIPRALESLALAAAAGAGGVIVQDLGLARLCRSHFPSLPLHASTQLVTHNLEGAVALRKLGFSRVVLSRELAMADIAEVSARSGVEVEVFVHGALCYSISGLCLFSAMEHGRSGNRGRCAYCCRAAYSSGGRTSLPFSMRDLRLDGHIDSLAAARVASLKIEGRMKSPLYVASTVKYYRDLLDKAPQTLSRADLETVFARRTTPLYADGFTPDAQSAAIDPANRTHLGALIGTVKRISKDGDGRVWLRFHTSRALERHDGLQFESAPGERPAGFGIGAMRIAISRRNVFEAPAGSDVEVEVPPGDAAARISAGAKVFCGSSQRIKRMFPVPPWREADSAAAGAPLEVKVTLSKDGLAAESMPPYAAKSGIAAALDAAANPGATAAAVRKAFSRTGSTPWRIGSLEISDPDGFFAPMGLLNELRRRLLEAVRVPPPPAYVPAAPALPPAAAASLKIRLDQFAAADISRFDETTIVLPHGVKPADVSAIERHRGAVRLAFPPWTWERDLPALRTAVKRLVHGGWTRWEAGDMALLGILSSCGVCDIVADWTLPAFNAAAISELAALGVKAVVASPEMDGPCRAALAAASPAVILPRRMAVPLFISLTKPAIEGPCFTDARGRDFECNAIDGLWVSVRKSDTVWDVPAGTPARTDVSWRKEPAI